MYENHMALVGTVGSEPEHHVSDQGKSHMNFRFVSTERKMDRATGEWVDGNSNWFTVKAFGRLAQNTTLSLHKGDRIIVLGRLQLREWKTDERRGVAIELLADAIGHDYNWGVGTLTRPNRTQASVEPGAALDAAPRDELALDQAPRDELADAAAPLVGGWPDVEPPAEPVAQPPAGADVQPARAS